MEFWKKLLQILNAKMGTPKQFGLFHWCSIFILILTIIFLYKFRKHLSPQRVRKIILYTSILLLISEVYIQVHHSFSIVENNIKFEYQWFFFPWQFCSTPMYIGVLSAIIKKGKFQDALYAFLATYSVAAGTIVMVYPTAVFTDTIGLNIGTMFGHGSMVAMGACLFASGIVKPEPTEPKTLLKALPVFATVFSVALILNEASLVTGILDKCNFSMFYINRHCVSPVTLCMLIQERVPYVVFWIIYIIIFNLAAYIVLLLAKLLDSFNFTKKSKEEYTVDKN